MKVRVITARVTVTCHDGTSYGDAYRLATTLLDHRAYPAQALMALYHERWEHEVTYLALRHTLLQGRVLRSGDPAGIEQEMWALLAVYQALRIAVTDAVQTVPGTRPRPRQLAGRRRDRPRPRHHRREHHRPRTATWPATSAAPSWPACTAPAGPASAPARSRSPLSRWNKPPRRQAPHHQADHLASPADIDPRHYKPPKPKPTLIDKLRQAAERGEPLDRLLKRLTSLHWSSGKRRRAILVTG